jgi:transposase-like protein
MKQKRRNHSPEFKARVALEAIKGVKTVQQIAAENHLHPVQVTQWKTQVAEAAAGIFDRGKHLGQEPGNAEQEKERLERKVGQLVVEVDWLKKKCKELGIDP